MTAQTSVPSRRRARRIPRLRHRSLGAPALRRLARAAHRHRSDAGNVRNRLGCGRGGPHRRLDDDRRDRRRRADRGGLSGNRRRGRRARDAAGPASGDAWRQSRATVAVLVFSRSAHQLSEKRRRRLSGARGQPPLWRRVRSRALRRAASFDHGDGSLGLRRKRLHQPAQFSERRGIAGRRLERRRRSRAKARRNDHRGHSCAAARKRTRAPTSARSDGPRRNGRWWNWSRASSSTTEFSGWCVWPRAGSRPCRFGWRGPRRLAKARPSPPPPSRERRARRSPAQSRCR